jgi:carbonic anhydrase/acetyltransferase-like protein (isoleucine patch superfamily)
MGLLSRSEAGLFGEPSRKLGTAAAREHNIPGKRMRENPFRALINRILQLLTMFMPGGPNLRVWLNRARGVTIGKDVFISYNVVLETGYPHLITIDDGVFIGIGAIVIAHFQPHLQETSRGVRIGTRAFIGPGVIILPEVEIGEGAVVTAGSVVTRSVPAMTMVQGNPAVPVAKCGVPLWPDTPLKEFSSRLRPISQRRTWQGGRKEE